MKIAIIGCGTMGQALGKRLSHQHTLSFFDRHFDKAQKQPGRACRTIEEAIDGAQIVILAIKPQDLVGFTLSSDQILVSILAGTPLKKLRQLFPSPQLVRMMPNLALKVGEALIGVTMEKKELQPLLLEAFSSLGHFYWLEESQMDAFTALAASGPAFFCALIESMMAAASQMGIESTRPIVLQMLQGTLALINATGQNPSEIIQAIASPQGITAAGLKKLEELELQKRLIEVFQAAFERAKQL